MASLVRRSGMLSVGRQGFVLVPGANVRTFSFFVGKLGRNPP